MLRKKDLGLFFKQILAGDPRFTKIWEEPGVGCEIRLTSTAVRESRKKWLPNELGAALESEKSNGERNHWVGLPASACYIHRSARGPAVAANRIWKTCSREIFST